MGFSPPDLYQAVNKEFLSNSQLDFRSLKSSFQPPQSPYSTYCIRQSLVAVTVAVQAPKPIYPSRAGKGKSKGYLCI